MLHAEGSALKMQPLSLKRMTMNITALQIRVTDGISCPLFLLLKNAIPSKGGAGRPGIPAKIVQTSDV